MKTSHPYYHQIQGQLHICNKTCCDLIVWTTVDCVVIDHATYQVANLLIFYNKIYIFKNIDFGWRAALIILTTERQNIARRRASIFFGQANISVIDYLFI